mmetsp:Transcript_4867/g.14322  ORF Transcript_4867/g.14322 Transcript_4867/m.14322 type:complete len:239 (+) Transcript_4867:376-1092(+)
MWMSDLSLRCMCTLRTRCAASAWSSPLTDWICAMVSRSDTVASRASTCAWSLASSASFSALSRCIFFTWRSRSTMRASWMVCMLSSLRSSWATSREWASSPPPFMSFCRSLVTRRSWNSRVRSTKSSASMARRSLSQTSSAMPLRKSRTSLRISTFSPPSFLMAVLRVCTAPRCTKSALAKSVTTAAWGTSIWPCLSLRGTSTSHTSLSRMRANSRMSASSCAACAATSSSACSSSRR